MTFDGRIGHCELELGGSMIMLSDEYPEMGVIGPKTLGGTPTSMNVYVEDADATFAAALAAGATELRPVQDQFYGDRSGQFEDPLGSPLGSGVPHRGRRRRRGRPPCCRDDERR